MIELYIVLIHTQKQEDEINYFLKFRDMPCRKKVYRDNKATAHWSAARNKERFSFRS